MKTLKEELLIRIKRKVPKNEQQKLSIFYDKIEEIKKNLDDMTIYISQHLELTTMKRVFLLINDNYPEGAFAIRDRNSLELTTYAVIVEQTILKYVHEIFEWAYEQARMYKNWEWKVTDLNDVIIPNLSEEYKSHLAKCKINYQAVGNDLKYIMDYLITIKVKVENQDVKIVSSKKFNFIVRAICQKNNEEI